MFIVFLKFSEQKSKASQYMDAHKAWIKQGIEDDVFLIVGSLLPNQGGCIVANSLTREELEDKLNQDPFVIENIVTADIHEVSPSMLNSQLDFLKA